MDRTIFYYSVAVAVVTMILTFMLTCHVLDGHEKSYHRRRLRFLEVKIKYFNRHIVHCKKYPVGDWIDLRAAETVTLKAGEVHKFRLGVAMDIPEGYEGVIVARSSTLEHFGLISPNGMSVIDNKYKGDGDEWHFPAIAVRDTTINFNDRICQFRLQKRQPEIIFTAVDKLDHSNRGGFGTTGKN
jgi:dUTP pyrophosphatase